MGGLEKDVVTKEAYIKELEDIMVEKVRVFFYMYLIFSLFVKISHVETSWKYLSKQEDYL